MWCGIYFSCTAASGGDETKEKQHRGERKGWRVKGKERVAAGKGRRRNGMCCQMKKGEEEKGRKTRTVITCEMSSKRFKMAAGDNDGEQKPREVTEDRGEIKGKMMEVEGVTHTWKMVFWSPTTSPSPTVRVS